MLGNGRLEALCFDGEKRLAHIRGKLRKKVWINQGDIILLSLRDYQDEKGDVILKYSADEARSLKAYGELPESAKINETDTYVHAFLVSLGFGLSLGWGLGADGFFFADTVTKVWMTMWSSTRIEMVVTMRRRLMLMRSKSGRGGERCGRDLCVGWRPPETWWRYHSIKLRSSFRPHIELFSALDDENHRHHCSMHSISATGKADWLLAADVQVR